MQQLDDIMMDHIKERQKSGRTLESSQKEFIREYERKYGNNIENSNSDTKDNYVIELEKKIEILEARLSVLQAELGSRPDVVPNPTLGAALKVGGSAVAGWIAGKILTRPTKLLK